MGFTVFNLQLIKKGITKTNGLLKGLGEGGLKTGRDPNMLFLHLKKSYIKDTHDNMNVAMRCPENQREAQELLPINGNYCIFTSNQPQTGRGPHPLPSHPCVSSIR